MFKKLKELFIKVNEEEEKSQQDRERDVKSIKDLILQNKIVTVTQYSNIKKISKTTVLKQIYSGKREGYKLGRNMLVRLD